MPRRGLRRGRTGGPTAPTGACRCSTSPSARPDPVITGAGSAAGLDACLHLYRKEFGAGVASAVARRMVVPPQRDGGRAQYIRGAVPDCDAETPGPLLTWIVEHLAEPMSVESLAAQNALSPRTFARRFRDETGTTPHAWITSQRVRRAGAEPPEVPPDLRRVRPGRAGRVGPAA